MANVLPGVKTLKIPGIKIRFLEYPKVVGGDVILKSTVTDSGNGLARTTLIRAGFVAVKKTSDGLFYAANDAVNGDRNAVPSVSSIGTGDAGWNGATVTIQVNGGPATVFTLAGGTATAAAAVVDLNALAGFIDLGLIADVSSTFVRIRSKRAGSGEYISCSSNAATFYGAGVTLSSAGTDADYRVLEGQEGSGGGLAADMLGSDGAATNAPARSLFVGAFVESKLLNLTSEARAVLSRRGSIFG